MKIIRLTAENVKKLKVVDITPNPGLDEITGKNESGKTSVLDAIWWALGGKEAIQSVPVREGRGERARAAGPGDMIVERKFLASGTTTLTVRNAAGAEPGTPDKKLPVYGSPQEMLDALIGRLSFDPLAFANKKAREQYEELKSIAKLAYIDALEAANEADFRKRTDVNRDAKAKRAQAAALLMAPDLQADPVDEADLLNQIEKAAEHNASIETRKARRAQAQRDANDKKADGVRLREQAAEIREGAGADRDCRPSGADRDLAAGIREPGSGG